MFKYWKIIVSNAVDSLEFCRNICRVKTGMFELLRRKMNFIIIVDSLSRFDSREYLSRLRCFLLTGGRTDRQNGNELNMKMT